MSPARSACAAGISGGSPSIPMCSSSSRCTSSGGSALPLAAQQAEIEGSKGRLEEILGRPVTNFAYPYGLCSDYSAETVTVVEQAGFDCASSSEEDNVWRGSDRFQLPRRIVFDWDGDEFARKLAQWLGG